MCDPINIFDGTQNYAPPACVFFLLPRHDFEKMLVDGSFKHMSLPKYDSCYFPNHYALESTMCEPKYQLSSIDLAA